MIVGEVDLRDVLLAGPVTKFIRQSFAFGQYAGGNKQHIDHADARHNEARDREVKKAYLTKPEACGNTRCEQVGRRADKRGHAAEDTDEAQQHHDLAGLFAHLSCQGH